MCVLALVFLLDLDRLVRALAIGQLGKVLIELFLRQYALRDVPFHDAFVYDFVSESCHGAECKFAVPTVK